MTMHIFLGTLLLRHKIRKKIQVTPYKCINFCFKLNSTHHIGAKEFKEIKWLPTQKSVEKCITTKSFKYWKWTLSFYTN